MPPKKDTRFSAEELDAAFKAHHEAIAEVAKTRDWDRWADLYTEDVDYIEHAMGTMKGREQVRTWINKTMHAFPGSHMTGYPSLWHVVDPTTARVICEVDNPMRDPGDGSIITATNITILTYAGDGLWSRAEDVYNPLLFGQAAMKWCKKAAELGTIDEPAQQWMDTVGKMFDRG
ncbi:nuclear transport factor 2 family protein [Gordonia sp. (in: high G+C Gram-positive bacteria)]|uniref:nuclear transport factor 2 family protein n=1 Tax=Gordonia sp. (in: high G+C Gram-positive bacteria) TaxID=84139 RepID=UPI0039E53F07